MSPAHGPADDTLITHLGTTRDRLLGFSRGSSALYAVLSALGIGRGDEVLLTGYTCVVVANSVKFLGGTCRYADIDPRTYGTDPDEIRERITERTRAIVVQHTYGIPCRVDEIVEVAGARGIPVIEDCALSLGSRYRDRVVGSFGAAAFWSGQWSKPLPTGNGGYLAVRDPALHARVHALWERAARPGIRRDVSATCQIPLRRFVLTSTTKARLQAAYRFVARRRALGSLVVEAPEDEVAGRMPPAFLSRLGRFQLRAWLAGLASWHEDVAHRARIAKIYRAGLADLGLPTVDLTDHEEPVFSRYPTRVGNKDEVLRKAERRAVEIGDWMTGPLHQAAADPGVWDYVTGMCPRGERAGRETINLPTHRRVDAAEARRVLEFLGREATKP